MPAATQRLYAHTHGTLRLAEQRLSFSFQVGLKSHVSSLSEITLDSLQGAPTVTFATSSSRVRTWK